MNPDSRQFHMPEAQFSGNGNQSFLSQGSYQSFSNMGMMPQSFNPLATSYVTSDPSAQHLGMQTMNGMQYQIPGQINAHLLQTQASQLLHNNQFRTAQDWRQQLSGPDRQHVINQLFTNISTLINNRIAQQGNQSNPQMPQKAEGLARSLEQHIYETAQSRNNYLQKITEQLTNLTRSGMEHLMTIAPHLRQEIGATNEPGSPKTESESPQVKAGQTATQQGLQSNQSQQQKKQQQQYYYTNQGETQPSTPSISGRITRSQLKQQQSNQDSGSIKSQSQPQTPAPTPPTHPPSPGKKEHSLTSSDPNLNGIDQNDELKGDGTSLLAGMRVTYLDLTQEEKDSVVAKLEQIRPTYLRIETLVKTLLAVGGSSEFEKVRKLTGMKQMIQAQLEVIEQGKFFIRPDVLQQLLPSLTQYFRYAELLVNGQQPRSVQPPGAVQQTMNSQVAMGMMTTPSPMMGTGMMVGQQQSNVPNASPHMTPNMMGSPNMRPGMMMQARPSMNTGTGRPMQMNPTLQASQQIQVIQSRLLPIQQQLQQIQQMMNQGVGPDQMQVLQTKQQELLRNQELLHQQYISLQQYGMTPRGPAPMRPVRPPVGMNVGDSQMSQQFNAMQPNSAAMASQRALQQQQMMAQMGRGQSMGPTARPNMTMLQQQLMMQQAQQQQQQQFQDLLATNTADNSQGNPSFLTDPFQGSPQLGNQKSPPPVQPASVNSNAKASSSTSGNQKKDNAQPTPAQNPSATSNPNAAPNPQQMTQMANLQGMGQLPNAMSPNLTGMAQMQMNMGVRPGMMPQNVTMMNQMASGRPFNPQFMAQQQVMNENIQMIPTGPLSPQMFLQNQMVASFQDQSTFEQPIPRPGSAAGKKQGATQQNLQNTLPTGMQQGLPPGMQQRLQSQMMQNSPQFFVGNQATTRSPGGMPAPSPFAQHPPQPSPTTSQAAKSTSENWADEFNFGSEPPPSASAVEIKEEGNPNSLESNLEDYFNLDYEPPEFDTLQEPNVGEADFTFDLSPPTKKAAKRSRDDDDGDDLAEKKVKTEGLEKELTKLTIDYPITYTIKNTPSSTSTMVCFTFKSVSFTISIQNRSLYESGLSKGLLTFSTTQDPDNLSGLVSDHTLSTSTSRVTDIVKIMVAAIKE